MMNRRASDKGRLSVWVVAKSVAAAFFGVQSKAGRERDFTKGSASQFVVIGAVATLVFVLIVWLVVVLTLRVAGV